MVACLHFSWVERNKLKKRTLNCTQRCEGALLNIFKEKKKQAGQDLALLTFLSKSQFLLCQIQDLVPTEHKRVMAWT